jgi:hypothetical protein
VIVENNEFKPNPVENHWQVKLERAEALVKYLQYQVGRTAMKDQLQLDFKTEYVMPRRPDLDRLWGLE